ncbi:MULTISPECIES: DUF5691 domain-containing protein [unclassified Nocardiopsis]|uniref:DUF5691 domain-containing protein n=1 Tax=unclassified Nocardiopsis TaxID=2649073 RepID=UPI001358289A|nr:MULTISPECIES: DUF5691 domain-containing protein [unclassified Nocardiopsis]
MTGTRAPEPLDPLAPTGSWDRLVSAALVGTARREVPDTPDLPATPGGNDASDLLDRAALATVRRAAGYVPATGTTPLTPDPGTSDESAEAGPGATRLLDRIIADRPELLPEWLERVAARGRCAARASLPLLLDEGARHSQTRPAIVAAAGTRGRWLAAFNPRWSYATGVPLPGDRFSERDWGCGTPGERRRALLALRTADPDRARELLTAVWPGLAKAELRRELLETLATGLGPADEEFLEQALDDRSAVVRGSALSLLTRLPGGAHAERLRGHVRAHASLRDDGSLRVDPPEGRDAALRRDLALAMPAPDAESANGYSERLWALVTHTPLDVWPELLGTDPAGVVAAATRTADAEPRSRLLAALANAAVVQRDAAWARAVLGALGPGPSRTTASARSGPLDTGRLLDLLPVAERCDLTLRALPAVRSSDRRGELFGATRGPWTDALSAEALRLLREPRRANAPVAGYEALCAAAALYMRPAHVTALPDTAPFDGNAAVHAYDRLRDTLRFRLDMHREL